MGPGGNDGIRTTGDDKYNYSVNFVFLQCLAYRHRTWKAELKQGSISCMRIRSRAYFSTQYSIQKSTPFPAVTHREVGCVPGKGTPVPRDSLAHVERGLEEKT